ncbi:uncharacterized protein IWZ02DRAFT_430099 [Phyllosticta citriasiana]|uniref:uncharacterized protein n=1 Tax=Phyllosticta citriasiana TaxID=595635 RepID=UPI0030FDA6A4
MAPENNPSNALKPEDGAFGPAPPPEKSTESEAEDPKPGAAAILDAPHKQVMESTGMDELTVRHQSRGNFRTIMLMILRVRFLDQLLLQSVKTEFLNEIDKLLKDSEALCMRFENLNPRGQRRLKPQLVAKVEETGKYVDLEKVAGWNMKLKELLEKVEGKEKQGPLPCNEVLRALYWVGVRWREHEGHHSPGRQTLALST